MKSIANAMSLLVSFVLMANIAIADVRLPAIFSDHMVLQRDTLVPVWGWADPGEEISVSIAGQTKTTMPGSDGKWMVKLAELKLGESKSLVVKGKNEIVIEDVLVGEVWLGSGQSNMAMTVKGSLNFEKEQAASNLPLIRMFKEESVASAEEQTVGKGRWLVCSPETVGGYSATLFFFGREIHQSLDVPVGLINSSVGGTPIESWIASDVQHASKELKAFLGTTEKDKGRKSNVGGLFNGKIAPLIPYAIRGALWYQGEANSVPAKAPFYEHQLPLLVNDWRSRWGYDFPFAWAQLPNFGGNGRDWPIVREAMLKTLALPKTGMGINIDIGDEKDIHPKNKQEVGRRLSLWALGTVYGQKVAATSGPLPGDYEIRDSEFVMSFLHSDGGLVAKGGELHGFEIAGADMQWMPAIARIENNKVVVSNAEVQTPLAIRYAWENFPKCNLYNGAGLPASPFRTDGKGIAR